MIELVNRVTNDPIFSTIAMTIVLAHDSNSYVQRTAERTIEMLRRRPVFEFTGAQLKIHSLTDGTQYTCDEQVCSCPGRRHELCKHRMAFLIFTAYAAMVNPQALRIAILMANQPEPEDIYSAAELAALSQDACRSCGCRLLDHELSRGLCDPCNRPPVAVALEVPWQRCPACGGKGGCVDCRPLPQPARFTPRRSVAVGVPNAQVQAEADALLAA